MQCDRITIMDLDAHRRERWARIKAAVASGAVTPADAQAAIDKIRASMGQWPRCAGSPARGVQPCITVGSSRPEQ